MYLVLCKLNRFVFLSHLDLTTLARSLQESTSLAKVVKSVLTPEMDSYLIYKILRQNEINKNEYSSITT